MDELTEACGSSPRLLCETVFDWTGSGTAAKWAGWLVEGPLRILLILVAAWLINRYGRKAVSKFSDRLAEVENTEDIEEGDPNDEGPFRRSFQRLNRLRERKARAAQRAETLGAVLRSLLSGVVWTIAGTLILSELGINLAPLIASAGVVGLAIGFGAQSVVRDFLAGMFVLIEDHYGVGDYIDAGEASGTVELVSLRATRMRDASGVLWIVPNGEIKRVGNYSQLYSQTRMQFEVAYDTDIDMASDVIKGVLDEVWRENRQDATVIEEPVVLGIDAFGDNAVVIAAVVKTDPSEQWAVAREIRSRIKKEFDKHGIEIPFPQRTVWVRSEDGSTAAAFEA
ncbi:MAG: mechanosensitive ion channel family protein [Acidimicrobiales bacterium]|nr:mechanosensitive ion channel family protein [Acidimicrobiales bacterium]